MMSRQRGWLLCASFMALLTAGIFFECRVFGQDEQIEATTDAAESTDTAVPLAEPIDPLDPSVPATDQGIDFPVDSTDMPTVDVTTAPLDLSTPLEQSAQIVANLERAVELANELQVALGSNAVNAAAAASAATLPDVGKVYLITVADNRDSVTYDNPIAAGTLRNAEMIERVVEHQTQVQFNGQPLNFFGSKVRISGNGFNRDRLLREIRNVPSTTNDVIFVYIACHGAFANRGVTPVFQMPSTAAQVSQAGVNVERSEIMSAIMSKPGRQWILISDSCASTLQSAPAPRASAAAAAAPPAERMTSALAKLLLFHRGVVDINGSSPWRATSNDLQVNAERGQIGIYATGSDASGYFTKAFVRASLYTPESSPSWQNAMNDSGRRVRLLIGTGVDVDGVTGRVLRQTPVHFPH